MGLDGFEESIGGKWKLTRNECFDEYLSLMGVGFIKRKVACAFNTVTQLIKLDDNRIQIITDGPKHSDDIAVLNEEVDDVDPFDNKLKTIVTWDPETKVLKTDATPVDPTKGKKAIVERKIVENGELLMEITLPNDNFVCRRYFKRVES